MTSTTEVRKGHAFDVGRLHTFLTARLPGYKGPLRVRQFGFGQSNPTFLLDTPTNRYVLRKKPPGHNIKTAHAVDREARVMSALHAADVGVPVPQVHVLCTDDTVIGTAFYVMEFVKGRIFTDPSMPSLKPVERTACYNSAVETLAKLHAVDHEKVGLATFGRSSAYFARQLRTLAKVAATQTKYTDPIPRFEDMLKWLRARLPAESVSIVHGDYKVDNLVFHPTEPRVIAVLDWEMSTIGHPMADLANLCVAFYLPRIEGFGPIVGLQGFDLEGTGIPSEQDIVKRYCKLAGRSYPDPNWDFYIAFFFFKMTVILQGIAARSARGVASSARASSVAQFVPIAAEVALSKMGTLQHSNTSAVAAETQPQHHRSKL